MQFSIITLLALAASVTADSVGSIHNRLKPRQNSPVSAEQPSMTDANGNVVPFNAAGVYQAAKAKGL